MKADRQAETAVRFGIKALCENLEADLLKVPGVVEVELDLDGFYDNLGQVILLTKYKIPEDFLIGRSRMMAAIILAAGQHGLSRTGDRIEDYGEHLYFVFQCDARWNAHGDGQ